LHTLTRNLSIGRLRKEPALLVAVMLVTNMFFNAMVTGDLPDNRFLFVAFGLLVMRSEKSEPQT
jgi:hypothetical protein